MTALAAAAYAALAWRGARDRDALIADIVWRMPISASARPADRIDALRTFINRNTQHKEDAEFFAMWRDETAMLTALRDTLTGARSDPVHTECSTRAMFMHEILEHWGYQTRSVWVYATSKDLSSHTFLDVRDPETGRWQSHDPSYDIAWRDAADGAPVSIAERGGDLSKIAPCNATGCSYDIVSREGFSIKDRAEGYFELISVNDPGAGKRYTVYTPRAETTKTFTQKGRTGTYCEVLAKNCRDGFFAIGGDGPHRQAAQP